jgi:hypothetical protein
VGAGPQPPIPNPQSPIPNPQSPYTLFINFTKFMTKNDKNENYSKLAKS